MTHITVGCGFWLGSDIYHCQVVVWSALIEAFAARWKTSPNFFDPRLTNRQRKAIIVDFCNDITSCDALVVRACLDGSLEKLPRKKNVAWEFPEKLVIFARSGKSQKCCLVRGLCLRIVMRGYAWCGGILKYLWCEININLYSLIKYILKSAMDHPELQVMCVWTLHRSVFFPT